MRTIKELKEWLDAGNKIMWNDPEPIIGNDYTIVDIDLEDIESNFEMITITYNQGHTEAQAYLHEIHKLK